MEKEMYVAPEMEVIRMEVENVIAGSGGTWGGGAQTDPDVDSGSSGRSSNGFDTSDMWSTL